MSKFTRHGAGNLRAAIKYLMRTNDHKGVERTEIRILRGDPEQIESVVEGLSFVQRYSSAVIAWAPEDKPTEAQINDVLDDFELACEGGLAKDRLSMLAILHGEQGGGVHVHVLIARVDLQTGLSFNPAPPRAQKIFDHMRDFHNYSHNWARPDDPIRARLISPSDTHTAQKLRDGWESGSTKVADMQVQVTDYLCELVNIGVVSDRATVLSALAEFGELTRIGDGYISLKPSGHSKAFRLKGRLFDEKFNADTYRADRAEKETARSSTAEPNADLQRLAEAARAEFERSIAKRAVYNENRYGINVTRATADIQPNDPVANPTINAGVAPSGLVSGRSAEHILTVSPVSTDFSHVNCVDENSKDHDGRASREIGCSTGADRSSVESVSRPAPLQTNNQGVDYERDFDALTEYLAAVNADNQRAAAHAHSTSCKLREVREKHNLDAKQRVEDFAKIELGRTEHRNALQNSSELAKLRQWTQGLREKIGQQSGFINKLRACYDRTLTALGAVGEHINGAIEKVGLGRVRAVVDEYRQSQSVVKPERSVAPSSSSMPKTTPASDRKNDFNF